MIQRVAFLLFLQLLSLDASPRTGFPTKLGGCPLPPSYVALDPSNLPPEITDVLAQVQVAAAYQQRYEKIPGLAVGVISDQNLLWSGGFGLADLNDPTSFITQDTIFRLGSVSKVFSVLELLLLHEQKVVNMEDDVQQYVPYFSYIDPYETSTRKITFRQLATHLSGLPREAPCNYQGECNITQQDAFSRIAQMKLIVPPDTMTIYSNLGFDILGNALSIVRNTDFNDMVYQDILKPLGMTNTGADIRQANMSRLATPYFPGGVECTDCLEDLGWANPAGSFYSSVRDLSTLVSFLFRDHTATNPSAGQIFDGQTIRESMLIRSLDRDRLTGFGLPWELYTVGDYVIRTKSGDINGYAACMFMVPELKLGLITLSNEDGRAISTAQSLISLLIPAFDQVMRRLQPTFSPPQPENYVGTYDGAGAIVQIYQAKVSGVPNAPAQPLLASGFATRGEYEIRWLGLPGSPQLFQRFAVTGDLESCWNLEVADDYQLVEFQVDGNGKVLSFTMDIAFGTVWKKIT